MLCRTLLASLVLSTTLAAAGAVESVVVAKDGKSFVLAGSGKPFTPWGFNYDRDYRFRLLEEYWDTEWDTVVAHFREMKRLGANTVRVHLQFEKFMRATDQPNTASLDRLEKLVSLAEDLGLYLDVTGLACYRRKDEPVWYAQMTEKDRWAAQAAFWAAIAKRCAGRPGVLAFDLINEPAVGTHLPAGQWVHPAELGGFNYVQFIALDAAGRTGVEVWQSWAHTLTTAIRREDPHRLITVGLLPLPNPDMLNGVSAEVDYMSVHLYPKSGRLEQDLRTLAAYALGKPVVIEETFPLECSIAEMTEFIEKSRPIATGWVTFYWGKPLAEMKQSKDPVDHQISAWLEAFQKLAPPAAGRSTPSPAPPAVK